MNIIFITRSTAPVLRVSSHCSVIKYRIKPFPNHYRLICACGNLVLLFSFDFRNASDTGVKTVSFYLAFFGRLNKWRYREMCSLNGNSKYFKTVLTAIVIENQMCFREKPHRVPEKSLLKKSRDQKTHDGTSYRDQRSDCRETNSSRAETDKIVKCTIKKCADTFTQKGRQTRRRGEVRSRQKTD